jgi:hypothetical protein
MHVWLALNSNTRRGELHLTEGRKTHWELVAAAQVHASTLPRTLNRKTHMMPKESFQGMQGTLIANIPENILARIGTLVPP